MSKTSKTLILFLLSLVCGICIMQKRIIPVNAENDVENESNTEHEVYRDEIITIETDHYEISKEKTITKYKIYENEDADAAYIVVKEKLNDGTVYSYINGILVHTYVENNIFAKQDIFGHIDCEHETSNLTDVYYPCGRTEYHNLVSTNTYTISVDNQGTLAAIISDLIAFGVGGPGIPYSTLINIAQRILSSNAQYIDVVEYKYYLYNYSTQISMNCYHLYNTLYNINSSGVRTNVDAWNNYYQVIL